MTHKHIRCTLVVETSIGQVQSYFTILVMDLCTILACAVHVLAYNDNALYPSTFMYMFVSDHVDAPHTAFGWKLTIQLITDFENNMLACSMDSPSL